MSATSAQTHDRLWRWVLFAILVSLFAITRQSLWNDEALTAVKAMQPTLADWWREMAADKASDLQMPLYMIYMWGFAKIFGVSEWALRGANFPWFILGIATFLSALPNSKKTALAIVALVCPFVWYYLSEARPYAMQLGASLMIFAGLYRFQLISCRSRREEALDPIEGKFTASSRRLPPVEDWDRCENRWVIIFILGVIALSGSSLLGMIWAGAACLAALWILGWPRLMKLAQAQVIVCLVSACALTVLAGYFLWTLKQGARASDVGRTDGRNLIFIIYELLGLGGLGPGRLEIRDEGLRAFVPFAKWLFVYSVLICDLLILGSWRIYRQQPRAKLIGMIFIIALPITVILGTGYVKEFRVLGRHFTPLLPVILFVLGTGLQARWARPHWVSKPLVGGFIILSLTSCLLFRFAAGHERDDYRDAANFTKAALQAGRVVWWNAGREGALYYGVPLANSPGQKNKSFWLMNPAPEILSKLTPPQIIVTSKPDVYDAHGAVARYLAQGPYFRITSLPAFIIWERKVESVKLAGTTQ